MHGFADLKLEVGVSVDRRQDCETGEDKAKATINGQYKVVHGLSIAAKMYDIEWPLREIQGHWFLKCYTKMTKYITA